MDNKPTVIPFITKKPNWVNTVMKTLSSRLNSNLFGVSKNGMRDINKVFGYNTNLHFADYYAMWRRGGLAARIVNGFARSCWRDGIKIIRGDDEVFEKELKILNKHGKLIKRLEQADVLNRIGSFSVLFVGVPDGLNMDQPLGTSNPNRLHEVYFRPYAEDGVNILEWETDAFSPRFGLPLKYQLETANRGENDTQTIVNSIVVHWSRIIHLAEGALDTDLEGVSSIEAVFNTLEDMVKVAGGSAEAYFRNARNRFSMETDPKSTAGFTAEEKRQLEEEAQLFQNEWQDFIRAGGVKINALNIPHASPADSFMVQLKILAGTTGYPIRILTGEGAGQLAGNEDKESYNQIVQDRRDLLCTEWVFEVLGILTNAKMMKLEDEDEVSWETPNVVSGKDRASIASSNATALNNTASALSSPALDGVIEVEAVLKLIFGDDAMTDIKVNKLANDGLNEEDLKDANVDDIPLQIGEDKK